MGKGMSNVLVCKDILLHSLLQHQHNQLDIGCHKFYHQFRRLVHKSWIGRINTDPQCNVKKYIIKVSYFGHAQFLHGHSPSHSTSTPAQPASHPLPYVLLSFPHTGRQILKRLKCRSLLLYLLLVSGFTYNGHAQGLHGHSPPHFTSTSAQSARHRLS